MADADRWFRRRSWDSAGLSDTVAQKLTGSGLAAGSGAQASSGAQAARQAEARRIRARRRANLVRFGVAE